MPIKIHRADARGQVDHGWLQSRFSFSFAQYYHPERMGFGALRVINDDVIAPANGFGMHPHRSMEIVTIVTEGALEHKDSQGNHDVIRSGEIQYMSAGEGIFHSEFNPSEDETTRLFQIWIHPHTRGGEPLYAKQRIDAVREQDRWVTLVCADGREGSITIRQDAMIQTARLTHQTGINLEATLAGRGKLLFVIDGSVDVGGETLNARDEMQIAQSGAMTVHADAAARLLLFDVPLPDAP